MGQIKPDSALCAAARIAELSADQTKGLSMSREIRSFKGDHEFLSNFYPHTLTFGGWNYPTLEHAFQAAKTEDRELRKRIRETANPADAKAIGRRLKLREGWDVRRLEVMSDLLWQKFCDPVLRSLLLETAGATLIESNWWYDHYWGVCSHCGKGDNHLGRLIMAIRGCLQEVYFSNNKECPNCKFKI